MNRTSLRNPTLIYLMLWPLVFAGCTIRPVVTPTVAKPDGPVTLPLLDTREGVFVNALIEGRPYRCQIDTGYTGVSVSSRLVEQLGLEGRRIRARHHDPYGMVPADRDRVVKIHVLRMGDVEFREFDAFVFAADHRNDCVDAILGFGLFTPIRWSIDGPGRTLVLGAEIPSDATVVSYKLEPRGTPVVAGVVDSAATGQVKFEVVLDTGGGGQISLLLPAWMRRLGIKPVMSVPGTARTASGEHPTEILRAHMEVCIADQVRVTNPFFAYSNEQRGCLGWPLLRYYQLTFDPWRKVVALRRGAG